MPRVRGTLIITVIVAECVGNLFIYIIGSFNYNAMSICPIILTLAAAVLLYFLPETPLFLVKQDKIAVTRKKKIIRAFDSGKLIFF